MLHVVPVEPCAQQMDKKERFAAAEEGFKIGLAEDGGASNHWQERELGEVEGELSQEENLMGPSVKCFRYVSTRNKKEELQVLCVINVII